MFRRLIFEDTATIFTLVAFATASTIFLAVAWRAIRMPRQQVDRFAQLPFNTESASVSHDSKA